MESFIKKVLNEKLLVDKAHDGFIFLMETFS